MPGGAHGDPALRAPRPLTPALSLRECSLLVQDRVEGDEFTLTQEFLSQMLGARRASVSEAMSALRKRGLASYHRGHVRILDRTGLIEACCVCYGLIRREFARVLGG